jgi:multiple sugar transport system substrate-binding protein
MIIAKIQAPMTALCKYKGEGMRKALRVALSAILTFSLTACGGTAVSEVAESPEAEESAAEDAADGELVFYTWWADAERSMGEALIADFEAQNPGVAVQQNYIAYNDYLSKLNTMVATNSTPDVFFIQEYLANKWGEKGVTADLTPFYAAAGVNPYEFYIDNAVYSTQGKIWCVNTNCITTCLY